MPSNAHKDIILIVTAGLEWEKCWTGKVVQFTSDNKAVVTVLSKPYCQDASLMGYLWCLIFNAAKNGFWFTAEHTHRCLNTLADAISCNKMDWSQVPSTMSPRSYG